MDLNELRDGIDSIDREIIERLNERVRLASEIGKIKMEAGQEIYVPSREEQVFEKLKKQNKGPLSEEAIKKIYREIISAAISLEKKLVIAYLGPEASYTQQAAMKNFGTSVTYKSMRTVPDVFDLVKRGDADYGVVPVENSTQGTVISSLDMLTETNLKIVAQIYLPITHYLLSQSPLDQITAVHSKDNALGQCRQWLARMLPGVELVETTSTSAAVQFAKENKTVAAIAGRVASDLYGVPIVAENVCDRPDNVTRFIVIGKECSPPLGGGQDKTSLVFTLHDKPGALLRALQCFSLRSINLCKIESRPSRQRLWDYYFYIDIMGHSDDEPVKEALAELESLCPMIKLLGSYPNTGI